VANGQFIEIGVHALGGAHSYRGGNHAYHPLAVSNVSQLMSGIRIFRSGARLVDTVGTHPHSNEMI
jgi:hypothetical protein